MAAGAKLVQVEALNVPLLLWSLQASFARFTQVERSAKTWGVIKLQAFILHALPLTCALTGSIKAQIDFTYQCSHCLTWRSSCVVHVCLITGVLTGSRCVRALLLRLLPLKKRSLLEKLNHFSALLCLFLFFFLPRAQQKRYKVFVKEEPVCVGPHLQRLKTTKSSNHK